MLSQRGAWGVREGEGVVEPEGGRESERGGSQREEALVDAKLYKQQHDGIL